MNSKSKKELERYYQNREVILAKRRAFRLTPAGKKATQANNRRYYGKKKETISEFQAEKFKKRKRLIDAVAVHYGCQNPQCQWKGIIQPYQLDFHHFDDTTKTNTVSQLIKNNMKKIAEEINKCVILCRNCHAEQTHGISFCTPEMMCNVNENLQPISHISL